MTDTKIREITIKAKMWANCNGFASDAEDIAQHVLIRLYKKRKAAVDRICIDYVRSAYGRTDKRAYKNQAAKSNEKRFYSQITDENDSLETSYKMNTDNLDFNEFQAYLESNDRAIVTLRFKWGMTEKEIADCFGMSEGRICQKLKEIKIKLESKITEQKQGT